MKPPPDLSGIRGLTLWPEWAGAVVFHGKRTENRSWHPFTKGFSPPFWIAIHAGSNPQGRTCRAAAIDGRASVRRACDVVRAYPDWSPLLGPDFVDVCQVRSSIVAVAQVYGVDTDQQTPWDDPGFTHWRLRNVHKLEQPVPCRGALGLWELRPDLLGAVQANLRHAELLDDGPKLRRAA